MTYIIKTLVCRGRIRFMVEVDSVEINLERAIRDCKEELESGNNKFAVHRLSSYIFECEKLLTEYEESRNKSDFYEENLADIQYKSIEILSNSRSKPSNDRVENLIDSVEESLELYRVKYTTSGE